MCAFNRDCEPPAMLVEHQACNLLWFGCGNNKCIMHGSARLQIVQMYCTGTGYCGTCEFTLAAAKHCIDGDQVCGQMRRGMAVSGKLP